MGHTRATRSGVCCHGKTGRGTGDGQCRQAAIRPGCQGGVRGDDAILAQLCERRHNYQTSVSWSIASAALDAGREPRTGPASESTDATPSGPTTTHSPTTIRGPRQAHRGRPQAGSARFCPRQDPGCERTVPSPLANASAPNRRSAHRHRLGWSGVTFRPGFLPEPVDRMNSTPVALSRWRSRGGT